MYAMMLLVMTFIEFVAPKGAIQNDLWHKAAGHRRNGVLLV